MPTTNAMTSSDGDRPANWRPMFLYAASLAVVSIVGSLIVVVLAESVFRSAEAWTAAGILWAYSVPPMALLSGASCFAYKFYRRATSAWTTSLFYFSNLAVIIVAAVGLAYGALWLERMRG